MVNRELLKSVDGFLKNGAECQLIKVSLKKKWKEKDIDEAIWWFEYNENNTDLLRRQVLNRLIGNDL